MEVGLTHVFQLGTRLIRWPLYQRGTRNILLSTHAEIKGFVHIGSMR